MGKDSKTKDTAIEFLKKAIGSLNHADDAQWTPEGLPRPEAVTIALATPGIDVSAAEIAAVAPTYRRMSAEELQSAAMVDAGADDEDSKPDIADPRLRATAQPVNGLADVSKLTVGQAQAEKAALDAEYSTVEKQLTTLNDRKLVINKLRDKLLPILEPQNGNTLAETIQAYQRASHRTQAERVSRVAAVNAVLGGTLGAAATAGAASPLDASRQVNRAHGSQLKPQPSVVVRAVPDAPGKAA